MSHRMNPPKPPRPCAIKGCDKLAKSRWGKWCSKHENYYSWHGSPHLRALPTRELRRYRVAVEATLVKYWNSKPVQAALTLAERLLHYTPTALHVRPQRDLEERMFYLRDCGVTPERLLVEVCCYYAFLEDHPHHFPDARSERQALARAIFKLAKLGRWRPGLQIGQLLGTLASESLGGFAIGLVRRSREDADRDHDLIRQATAIINEEKPCGRRTSHDPD